jgi:hypothetical protein
MLGLLVLPVILPMIFIMVCICLCLYPIIKGWLKVAAFTNVNEEKSRFANTCGGDPSKMKMY